MARVGIDDAVYDPRAEPGRNERDSADLAAAALGERGAPAERIEQVGALVLATIDHAPPADGRLDREAAVLLDADLAVLAAPPDEYDRYARAVREEFAYVPDEAFAAGRRAVLEALLAKPLFLTEEMRDAEAVARANLARELSAAAG